MNSPNLPHRVPLPDDVRARALDTVLAGLDERPGPARRPWLPIAVAAVIAVLAVSVPVALSVSSSTSRPDAGGLGILLDPASAPASVDIRSREGLVARCAAALTAATPPAGAGGPYPPPATWFVPHVLDLGSDVVLVVNDEFACHVGPAEVTVSATSGPAVGPPGDGVSAVRLSDAVVALLNPQRRSLQIEGTARPSLGVPDDDAVQLLLLNGTGPPRVSVGIDGGDPQPLPDPAPPVVDVVDRTLPVNPYRTDDEIDMETCVRSADVWGHSRPDLWTPVLRRDDIGGTPLLVGRIGDQYVGACLLAEDGPRFVVRPMPAVEGTVFDPEREEAPQVVVQLDPLTGEQFGAPVPPGSIDGPECTIRDGVAACASGPGSVVVRLLTAREDLRIAPVPGR